MLSSCKDTHMLEKITETEIEFMEMWHYPPALVECLFSNFDNLEEFDGEKFSTLRQYQYPMISFEPLIDYDPSKTEKQNFQMKKNVGDVYNFSARKIGKTQCSEKIDIPISMLHNPGWQCGFSSGDAGTINAVLDPVKRAIDFHPILRGFKRSSKASPAYKIIAKNGWQLLGINQNLKGKCVDDKTEILTNDGWKTMDNISKKHKVLSMNPKTDKADFFPIKEIYKFPKYEGIVYETNGNSKFVFTPEHKVYYNWSDKQDWKLRPIKSLNINKSGYIWFKQDFDYECKEYISPIVFKIRENNKYYKSKEINLDDWLEFLGWFISEGSLSEEKNGSFKIVISQYKSINPNNFRNICSLLERMGVNYYSGSTYIAFRNKEILTYLKKNCYSGDYIKRKSKYNSHTKTVPDYFKKLSKRQIKIFLNSYFLGDGSFKNGDFTSCCSCSKQLSDNIQILLLKLGHSTAYRYSKRDGCYYINILISKHSCIPQFKIEKKQYKGRMWCVRTEPFNLIFIRRQGRCCWTGNSPGSQFVGKHLQKIWLEENSYETEEVFKLRKESVSELGAVLRQSGMTNFTKQMPTGRTFYRLENKKKIINLPQFVNPYWDDKEKEDRMKEYGGSESPSYRIFVEGEVIEDGVSEFDIERVQACYNNKSRIKRFELKKENFVNFKSLIIVERPKNSERIFICGDIGDGAGGSDIIVMSEVGDKYVYLYNIVLYNYTEDEQEEVFDWLILNLQANIVALDCGDGTGRGLYHRLEKKYPKENLVWYAGNKKVTVGYEKDEKGNVVMVKGAPVCLEEFMSEWSVRRLKTLLYETRCVIPTDTKFDNQINSVISTRSGSRTLYACTSTTGDHLFDAWKVFGIAQWLCKDFNATPNLSQNWSCGVCSWT